MSQPEPTPEEFARWVEMVRGAVERSRDDADESRNVASHCYGQVQQRWLLEAHDADEAAAAWASLADYLSRRAG